MDIISALLLALSASLTAVRNVLTKSFSGYSIKNREFFGIQATIFGAGSTILLIVCLFNFNGISAFTFFSGLIYGIMLLCAQWFYTIALTNGKTALCATIYSFGFVIPTLSGTIFWEEELGVFSILGILTIIPALIISSIDSKKNQQKESKSSAYLIPLIIAMLCSGGLGIVQKIQQKSEWAYQTSSFILVAFVFSFLTSLIFFLTFKKGEKKPNKKAIIFCLIVGSFFSVCNLLNTTLAGRLDSALFFPLINVGAILLSLLLGAIVYKERLSKKDILVVCIGVCAIVLVNL